VLRRGGSERVSAPSKPKRRGVRAWGKGAGGGTKQQRVLPKPSPQVARVQHSLDLGPCPDFLHLRLATRVLRVSPVELPPHLMPGRATLLSTEPSRAEREKVVASSPLRMTATGRTA
jgi:hypothetical protein